MAGAAETATDLASILTQDEIPIKLRCATCNKLAVNAYRLPCCDQSICEPCQGNLPPSCPVCEHSPLSGQDCKPSKALRVTIKVFLRTEEKKREAHKAKQQNDEAQSRPDLAVNKSSSTEEQIAPVEQISDNVQDSKSDPQGGNIVDDEAKNSSEPTSRDFQEEGQGPQNIANDNHEETSRVSISPEEVDPQTTGSEGKPTEGKKTDQPADVQVAEVAPQEQANEVSSWNNNANGFNQNMQNMNTGWSNFQNMSGMSNMNFNPMAFAQGMFPGGFGGQGMGMNAMSGMVMGGNMGYNAGAGGFGDWNGQNSWNTGQDKINNPDPNGGNFNGMGDFGPNSGFFPSSAGGGYNMHGHGGYNQMNPQQQFSQYQQYPYQSDHQQQNQSGYSGQRHGANYVNEEYNANGEQINPSAGQQGEQGDARNSETDVSKEGDKEGAEIASEMVIQPGNTDSSGNADPNTQALDSGQNQTVPSFDMNLPYQNMTNFELGVAGMAGGVRPGNQFFDPSSRGRGMYRGRGYSGGSGFRGRAGRMMPPGMGMGRGQMEGSMHGGGFASPQVPSGGQGVVGAPTAPKALRQGLPNTGISGRMMATQRRGGAMSMNGEHSPSVQPSISSPVPESASKGPQSVERRSRSRSTSRDRADTSRPAEDAQEAYAETKAEQRGGRPEQGMRKERTKDTQISSASRHPPRSRSRSRSHASSRRPRHDEKSRRRATSRIEEPDGSIRREQDRDGDSRYSHGKRRDSKREEKLRETSRERDHKRRRHHRSRSRSPVKDVRRGEPCAEPSVERERDRTKHRRDRQRDMRSLSPGRRHRDERPRSRTRRWDERLEGRTNGVVERPRERERERPRNARDGRDDKRQGSTRAEKAEVGIHTLEREARNRERLLKEQQRRNENERERHDPPTTLSHSTSRKRDGDTEPGNSDKRRRKGRRGSSRDLGSLGRRVSYAFDDENEESRAARVESEREASRWE